MLTISFSNELFEDLEDVFRPDSCTNSPLNGDQFLRDGLKVYCEDRWSVCYY